MSTDPNKKKKEEPQAVTNTQTATPTATAPAASKTPTYEVPQVDTAQVNTYMVDADNTPSAVTQVESVADPKLKGYANLTNWNYAPYVQGESAQKAQATLQKHIEAGVTPYESQWNAQVDDIVNKILNREQFSYNVNEDALYQQYADTYKRNAEQMAADTTGRAAAMTGGYGNSWASTLGASAYAAEMQKLNDKIPELYQMAYDMYQNEGQNLYNQYGLLSQEEAQDYARYRDTVSDYINERDYLSGRYDAERNFDYGMYSDDKAYAFDQYWKAINRRDDITTQERNEAIELYNLALDTAYKNAELKQQGITGDRNFVLDAAAQNSGEDARVVEQGNWGVERSDENYWSGVESGQGQQEIDISNKLADSEIADTTADNIRADKELGVYEKKVDSEIADTTADNTRADKELGVYEKKVDSEIADTTADNTRADKELGVYEKKVNSEIADTTADNIRNDKLAESEIADTYADNTRADNAAAWDEAMTSASVGNYKSLAELAGVEEKDVKAVYSSPEATSAANSLGYDDVFKLGDDINKLVNGYEDVPGYGPDAVAGMYANSDVTEEQFAAILNMIDQFAGDEFDQNKWLEKYADEHPEEQS